VLLELYSSIQVVSQINLDLLLMAATSAWHAEVSETMKRGEAPVPLNFRRCRNRDGREPAGARAVNLVHCKCAGIVPLTSVSFPEMNGYLPRHEKHKRTT
jgi:hypothetical protein